MTGKQIDPSGKELPGVATWVPVEKISRLDVFDNYEALTRLKQLRRK